MNFRDVIGRMVSSTEHEAFFLSLSVLKRGSKEGESEFLEISLAKEVHLARF